MDKLGSYLTNNPKIHGVILGSIAIIGTAQVAHVFTKPKLIPCVRCYDTKGNVVDYTS